MLIRLEEKPTLLIYPQKYNNSLLRERLYKMTSPVFCFRITRTWKINSIQQII